VQATLLTTGASVFFLWGLGHLVPTRSIVNGFGEISGDNRRIITMEWIIEALTLCFLGVLVALMTWTLGAGHVGTVVVARAPAAMLFVLAAVSAATGAKTSILPMKLCPLVKSVAAGLIIAGTLS